MKKKKRILITKKNLFKKVSIIGKTFGLIPIIILFPAGIWCVFMRPEAIQSDAIPTFLSAIVVALILYVVGVYYGWKGLSILKRQEKSLQFDFDKEMSGKCLNKWNFYTDDTWFVSINGSHIYAYHKEAIDHLDSVVTTLVGSEMHIYLKDGYHTNLITPLGSDTLERMTKWFQEGDSNETKEK